MSLPSVTGKGLVHISQVVQKRIEVSELKEMFAIGETCWVKVLSVDNDPETRKNKISLSMKFVSQMDGQDLDPNNGFYLGCMFF